MSEDIYSKADRAKKVKQERGEWEEKIVDIYESADTFRSAGPEEAPPRITAGNEPKESAPPQRRSFRAAAVCLGLLCVLLLAGIIGLVLQYMTVIEEHIREREQMKVRCNNSLTELIKANANLSTVLIKAVQERNSLAHDFKENLTGLMKEKQDLVKERKDLRKALNNTCCCPDWKMFGSSCYYSSTEGRTWEESRRECRERGADLVIINNREELDFIGNFKQSFWIGLSDSGEEGIWKWVDGTRLPEEHKFWRSEEPNGGDFENCVEQEDSTPQTSWNDLPCNLYGHSRPWVCERNTSL